MQKTMNLNDAVHHYPNIFDFNKCNHLVSFSNLVARNKGKTVNKSDDMSRKVFTYAFGENKQDSLYKQWIKYYLFLTLQEYYKKFVFAKNAKIVDIQILRYPVGNYYKPHVDYSTKTPRTLSAIINLNDNYVGGELYFTNQTQKITLIYELKQGDIVIFPSNFLYPHGIMPVVKGTRHSIICWLK